MQSWSSELTSRRLTDLSFTSNATLEEEKIEIRFYEAPQKGKKVAKLFDTHIVQWVEIISDVRYVIF